jgi:hypothetical protein
MRSRSVSALNSSELRAIDRDPVTLDESALTCQPAKCRAGLVILHGECAQTQRQTYDRDIRDDLVAVFTGGGYNAESTPPDTIMAKIIQL